MSVTRHFLGWERPLLELAGEWLLDQSKSGILDLSDWLVIVPTRNSGRRLREMLAQLAHERGQGLLAPPVTPPEYLLSLISDPAVPGQRAATADASLLTWIEVLRGIHLEEFRSVFPVDPVDRDFNWALSTANGLIELRQTLGENGLEIADVQRLLGTSLEEPQRWRELAKLEKRYLDQLSQLNLADVQSLRKKRAGTPDLPAGIERLAVIGTPDPVPLTLRILEQLSATLPTDIIVYAPEKKAGELDKWGRPNVESWTRHPIDIPSVDSTVHLLPNVLAQAESVAERIVRYDNPSGFVAVGVMDEEITPALERRLLNEDQPVFSPHGIPLKSKGIVHLLRCLRDLLRQPEFAGFLELLRCPDYSAWLRKGVSSWNPVHGLRKLDDIHETHLPRDLPALRRHLNSDDLRQALDQTEDLLKQLRRESGGPGLVEILFQIISARNPAADSDAARAFRAAAERMAPLLESIAASATPPAAHDCLELIIRAVETETLYDEREPDAVVLSGWLEQLWEDAPHLLLTGFNDGFVPESIVGDPFLPENLRRQLAAHVDFPTNERRLARDAYLLTAMLASRRESGRVDFFLSKLGQEGDPLRPSRLLFRCPDQELPERAQKLFGDAPMDESNLPWTPGFVLQPSGKKGLESMSVTSFRSYLKSPFHFYLERVEKLQAVDSEKQELDAMDFGNFVHKVLREFGEDESIRDSTDEETIRKFLESKAKALALSLYGPEPVLPIRIQLRSAGQRLAAAARKQAEDRQAGWKIERTEFKLSEKAWEIGGMPIHGKVDRLDRHEKTGEVRVLDYKTSDSAETPDKVHVSRITASTRTDELRDYAIFQAGKNQYRWKDLQLPLYRLGLAEEYGPDIACGYFQLPKAMSDTGIQLWKNLRPEFDDAARRCAEGVIADVRSGRFWPCHLSRHDDDFEPLHLGVPERTIDTSNLAPA